MRSALLAASLIAAATAFDEPPRRAWAIRRSEGANLKGANPKKKAKRKAQKEARRRNRK